VVSVLAARGKGRFSLNGDQRVRAKSELIRQRYCSSKGYRCFLLGNVKSDAPTKHGPSREK
jgi:hypothetical protein